MSGNTAPMGLEEFQVCITELLGEVDPAATKNWLLYAQGLDESGTESKGVFFDEICGELQVIRDRYSPDIARQLYDLRASDCRRAFKSREIHRRSCPAGGRGRFFHHA